MGRWHARTVGVPGGTALAATAAAMVWAAGALPAHAAGPVFTVRAGGTEVVAPRGADGAGTAFHSLLVSFAAQDGRSTLTGVKVAVDAGRAAGVAELSLPAPCSFTDAEHLRALCVLGTVANGGGSLKLGVRAAAGALAGLSGTITYTVTAGNASERSDGGPDRSTVSVAHGPDLAVAGLPALSRTKPGAETRLDTGITNQGDQDVRGVVLYFHLPTGYLLGGDFANCGYPTAPDGWVLCRFDDTVIHPGDVLTPSVPITVVAGANPPDGRFEYGVDATGGPRDKQYSGSAGPVRHGAGAPLTLVAATARPGADFGGESSVTSLETGQVNDLAALADDLDGTLGDTVPATFAVKNTGDVPAPPLQGDQPGAATAYGLNVTFPGGVLIAAAPANCAAAAGGARPTYFCRETRVLTPGESETFAFQVRLTEALDRAAGRVTLAAGGGGGADADQADDVADFAVTSRAATGSPGAGTSTATQTSAPKSDPGSATTPTGPAPTDSTGSANSPSAPASSAGPSSTGPALAAVTLDAGPTAAGTARATGRSAARPADTTPAATDPQTGGDLAQTGGGDTRVLLGVSGAVTIGTGVAMVLIGARRRGGAHSARPGRR